MKKVVRGMGLLITAMAITLTPLTASAHELSAQAIEESTFVNPDGLFGTKYIVNADVTVRSGPGYSYSSVGKLYKNDVVTIKSIGQNSNTMIVR